MVQWLKLCALNAADPGSIPGQGTRFHMLQLNILHTATQEFSCHNIDLQSHLPQLRLSTVKFKKKYNSPGNSNVQ